jgi:hypothetical protein
VNIVSVFLVAVLALFLGWLNLALWVQAANRAKRRRRLMRRRAMGTCYPGAVGTGLDDDPYLLPFQKALSRMARHG